jgi:hypothetical protein
MRLVALLLPLVAVGCGYDGGYRYSCQDPANWEAEECNLPQCKVSGTCTVDIVGFDPALEAAPVSPETTMLP